MRRVLIVGLVSVVAFVSGGWLLQRGDQQGSVYEKARLFDQILTHVANYYVDSLDERQLYDMAIDGMLQQLDDPYTTFLREENLRRLTRSTTGNYGGLGIRIEVRDGWITIITPLPETPAERVGLRAGDRIIEVDGRSTRGWDSQRAVSELTGEPGSQVKIKVLRAGLDEPIPFDIVRAQIHVSSVENVTLLAPDVGYVSLNTVSEGSSQEVHRAIEDLRRQGATDFILDLRNNPGGVLSEGVGVADLFLERGAVVVKTKGRAPGTTQTYSASHDGAWPSMPLVVLVNELSASAAEIVAGALQDHDRAVVVGTNTFGKGVAQHVFRLSSTEALRITTSRWYTPDGRSIDRPPSSDETPEIIATADSGQTAAGGDRAHSDSLAGGIRPDLVVLPDTLTTLEQEFARALGTNVPAYQDVLTSYSIELKGEGTITDPDFAVSDGMVAELLSRLRSRDVSISDVNWRKGIELVRTQLGYEIARYVFGREFEIQRRAQDDPQVQKAIELLRQAETQQELLQVATK